MHGSYQLLTFYHIYVCESQTMNLTLSPTQIKRIGSNILDPVGNKMTRETTVSIRKKKEKKGSYACHGLSELNVYTSNLIDQIKC